MALDGTYNGLLASISDWLVRSDLTAAAPDFVTLVDADLNAMTQRLRIQEVEQALVTVPGSRYVALPAGYDEPLGLWLNWTWGREPLEEATAENIGVTTDAGRPCAWCVDGADIAFDRPADQAYPLVFRMVSGFGLAAGLAPSTYVLKTYPSIYLFGALLKSAPYLKDDDRLPTWNGLFGQAMQAMVNKEGRSRSGAALRVDAALTRGRRFDIVRGW